MSRFLPNMAFVGSNFTDQVSREKVMFSQACVNLFTVERGCPYPIMYQDMQEGFPSFWAVGSGGKEPPLPRKDHRVRTKQEPLVRKESPFSSSQAPPPPPHFQHPWTGGIGTWVVVGVLRTVNTRGVRDNPDNLVRNWMHVTCAAINLPFHLFQSCRQRGASLSLDLERRSPGPCSNRTSLPVCWTVYSPSMCCSVSTPVVPHTQRNPGKMSKHSS